MYILKSYTIILRSIDDDDDDDDDDGVKQAIVNKRMDYWICISLACSTSSKAGKFNSGETYPETHPRNIPRKQIPHFWDAKHTTGTPPERYPVRERHSKTRPYTEITIDDKR